MHDETDEMHRGNIIIIIPTLACTSDQVTIGSRHTIIFSLPFNCFLYLNCVRYSNSSGLKSMCQDWN